MKITRQQLYDKVWEMSTGALQKELNLSYVELKKMCEELNIPRPSSAYWTALNFGKKVDKIALPASTNDMPEEVETEEFRKNKVRTEVMKSMEKAVDSAALHEGNSVCQGAEIKTNNDIFKVSEILLPTKDPIIIDTVAKHKEKVFQKENGWAVKNSFKCNAENYLDIHVSKDSFARALRIFYAIIRAARHIGYEIDTKHKKDKSGHEEGGTFIIVKGQRLQVDLTESNRQVKNTKSNYRMFLLVPSGDLKFRILANYSSWNKEIKDTPSTRLEHKIEVIIRSLEQEADKRIEQERQQQIIEEQKRIEEIRKWQEEEKRKRLEALRKDEREKVMSLLLDVERHAVAERMYDYIRDFQKALTNKGVEMTDEIQKDIEWMQKKADWMNPFLEVEDEILTSEDFTKILHPTEKKANNPYYSWDELQGQTSNYWQMKNAWWQKK